MVTTRRTTMTDATFDYVVNTLMCIKTKSHTYKVLREYDLTSAYDIISMDDATLDSLVADEVDDKNVVTNKDKPIPTYNKSMIRILGNFCRFKQAEFGGKLTVKDIMGLDIDEWSQYRVGSPMIKIGSNIPATNTSSTTVIPSEVKEFRKGMIRDANQYPVLKGDRNFDNWRRKVMILARTHQVSDVFTTDPKYVPISSEDVWLFEEKQSSHLMY
jgi:hypothetical protein